MYSRTVNANALALALLLLIVCHILPYLFKLFAKAANKTKIILKQQSLVISSSMEVI
jgi:hypothetical protein